MDFTGLKTLEYYKIIQMLADQTSSFLGREMAEALLPDNAPDVVERRLMETQEATDVLGTAAGVPLGGVRDIRPSLQKASLGAVLTAEELLAVGSTLYAARRMKAFVKGLELAIPLLTETAEEIEPLPRLEQSIESTLDEHGAIRDHASAELARIRRELRASQNRIKEKLDGALRAPEYQKYFQDALVTMRGDRYVIPIKQEYRHAFPGIVHDQSASGATVFIEPLAVVELNNEVKQLQLAERHEIERVLQLLTAQAAQAAPALNVNCARLARLDFAFAKARLGIAMRAERPELNERGWVDLKRARHPLIAAAEVTPIDIELGRAYHTLLITGPNTGGKTVSMKTLGLLALMTQAGLFIPAGAGSKMPVFHNVFADIGDEQSIEQSLSTFSAHMTNLVRILNQVSADDLLLIDEMGAGTDPEEGAALAMAILEYLLRIGAKTIATTHYSELKTFAYTKPGIENACVEFDVQTLRPTYRLLIGIPGGSNAFAISRRLGLSDELIDQAKRLISEEHASFEEVLNTLETRKTEYETRIRDLEARESRLRRIEEEWKNRQAEADVKRERLLQKARQDSALLMRNTRREAERIIAQLKEQFHEQSARERQQAVGQARRRLREAMEEVNFIEDRRSALPRVEAGALRPGDVVYVTTVGQKGTVAAINGPEVVVQFGVMKMTAPLDACRMGEKEASVRFKAKNQAVPLARVMSVERQIDVRGMTVDEAAAVLDKYIDDAVLAGLNQILVIHGKGTGALRKGIRSYLKNSPYVRDISIGEAGEGGDGATIVKLM